MARSESKQGGAQGLGRAMQGRAARSAEVQKCGTRERPPPPHVPTLGSHMYFEESEGELCVLSCPNKKTASQNDLIRHPSKVASFGTLCLSSDSTRCQLSESLSDFQIRLPVKTDFQLPFWDPLFPALRGRSHAPPVRMYGRPHGALTVCGRLGSLWCVSNSSCTLSTRKLD